MKQTTTQQDKDHHLNDLLHGEVEFDAIQDRCIDVAMTMHAGSAGK